VFRFKSECEVIAAANNSAAGLAAYFYSRDVSRKFRVLERLEFGMVGINTGLISTEWPPIGGVKESGNCRKARTMGSLILLELKYACLELA
jgi:succinate-semialdehyde dehydrogenase/glutarate-semialdehyde dehydrogenase